MSVEKFLKQRAVKIIVDGSYTLPNWYDAQGRLRTFACRTKRVSPFRMIVDVPVVGKIGDRLTSYFEEFGRFEGSITDTMSGSFLFELEMTRAMREKFADKLTWIEKRQKDPSIREVRDNPRFVPSNPHAVLTLADGSTRGCFLIDVSQSGAAVSSEVQPPIGMPLAVGACIGRVVRHLPNGFAIKFVETYKQKDLVRLISRKTREPQSASAEADSVA
ncbi:PilZ domain-containing protein [Bradyrhizobium sp. ISRA443]|uniref:PilZ domain-containing protein n=1 Tax=unclassified Bradyrhizobium TaxID=2631580 RepID=UPI002479DE0D|nr:MULTISPECIES: PilZ domain-containing protein [unclassified Bradyrhizobium]WGR93808.1 PilZ domain-containing protein [Bradyrhizobium sp. ISRA435]WGR98413.1 PilZ domain-containing protein [Bradyrhizobium sp. ISRA436]WGS05302.1 PilZ domain-containing protein [Bradyrhizobium sp. ISRA437]WGS12188.1 PilZ domain-containing protein [Bradyrhizobium sp. ISRA443]